MEQPGIGPRAGACWRRVRRYVISRPARVPRVVVLALAMTMTSSSIFENERLKPGIYKLQNIHNDAYLDIEVGTRRMRCRPARDLGEGRGLVCRHSLSAAHV